MLLAKYVFTPDITSFDDIQQQKIIYGPLSGHRGPTLRSKIVIFHKKITFLSRKSLFIVSSEYVINRFDLKLTMFLGHFVICVGIQGK